MMIKNSFYEKDGIAYYEADRAMGKELPKEAETLLEEAELLKKKSEKDKFLLMAGTVIQAFKKERCDSQLVRQWFRKLEHKLQVDGSRADQHFGYIGEVKKELEHLAEQAFECGEPNIPEDLSQAVKIAADYAARHYREAVGLGDAAEAAGVGGHIYRASKASIWASVRVRASAPAWAARWR